MKRLILLDAHAILHRAYHALPDFATTDGAPTGALFGLSTMLIKIIEDLKPEYLVACYDVKGPTYRHEAYEGYKAQRKKADDDLVAQMASSRDIFAALGIPIYDKQGYEADDMLGTIVEQLTGAPERRDPELEIVIASGDMDTLQLVSDERRVKVYTLKKGIKDTVMYDEGAVRARFGFGPELIPDYKGLRGDPSDNIPGIKGVGEKTATSLITAFGHIEDMYRELGAGNEKAFAKAGLTPRLIQIVKDGEEDAEFSKVLATINRSAPIEFHMPEPFAESLDMEKANSLWTKLEFRSMGQRLKQAISGKKAPAADPAPVRALPAPEALKKAALALWLVDSGITDPQLQDILDFAHTDDFESASKAVFAALDGRGLRRVYEDIELPLIPVIGAMEKRGIKVDRGMLAGLSKEYHRTLAGLEERIWKEAGTEFNIASPKQLGDILFDKLGLKPKNAKKTGGGARSTRESELEKMRDMHPVVPLIFEYREVSKLLSTYIDAIPPLLDGDDRLHTHFIQAGTTTGRMASVEPNLQNIPVKSELGKKIRYAFIPEKGFKLVSFDYSQMELRIAAFMSGDEKLIDIFRKGEDVHTAVAASVFKVAPAEVTPEMRRRAKVINFGIIYGMGVMALKQNLGSTREEAQTFLNGYFETFSALASYLDQIKEDAARRGYTETFYGRRRYFEGIASKIPYIRAAAERMAVNAPIQGTEADIIKLAMAKIDGYIRANGLESDAFQLLQVHDELVCEIREDKADEVAKEIERIMESVIGPKETKGVVMKAAASIGDDWGSLK
ncbi:MAG: hypothetical protein KGI69_03955 [Patescibacteria group bacterium]|nr:hypothetical protein [Patescibacteria group bacterium]